MASIVHRGKAYNVVYSYTDESGIRKQKWETSFTSGLWFDEEGYKYDFWEKAQTELQLETWPQLTDSQIIALATKPFGILMRGSYRRQNPVSEPNYMKLFDIFYESGHEAAETLKAVFLGNDDKTAFDRFMLETIRPKPQKNGEEIAVWIEKRSIEKLVKPYQDLKALSSKEILDCLNHPEKLNRLNQLWLQDWILPDGVARAI